MLTIQGIDKNYGNKQALKNVSLTISEGSCYGLIGPNGAGKSTLMKIITTIIQADHGEVVYNGNSFNHQMKHHIGYIPQEICLEQTISAEENLYFFGRLYGLKGKELKRKAEDVLRYIGLTENGPDQVTTFSGGMKRRLNIGCALMNDPTIILMDEPTVGIDPQSRNYIYDMIENLKNKGCTIIYASHYIEEVERLCDEVAFIDHGQIIESGSLGTLLKKHANPAVFVQGDKLPSFITQSTFITRKVDGYLLFCDQPLEFMKKVIEAYQNKEQQLYRLELLQPRLEDVFLSLTGNQLRD